MNNRITQIFKQRYLSDLQTAFIVFWVLDLLEGIDSGFQSDWFFYATIFTSVATALLLAIYATQKVRNDKLNEKITPWVEVTEPTGYIKTKKNIGTLESNLLFVALRFNACHLFLSAFSRRAIRRTFIFNRYNPVNDMDYHRIRSHIQYGR